MIPGSSLVDGWRLTAVAWLLALLSIPVPASAQLAASGRTLTATTANAAATFQGPDLVELVNSLTGEPYLVWPTQGQLGAVDTMTGSGEALAVSDWKMGMEGGNQVATIVAQGPARSLTLAVHIDTASQEIVVRLDAAVTTPGLRGASWSIAGLDLAAGRLIVPANSGIVFDLKHPGIGAFLQYPNTWHAQMAVYEAAEGSFVLYSTDRDFAFKQLRVSTRGQSSVDVAVLTEAIAPFPSAVAVPTVEWRLKAFAGDWRTAAATYRSWLAAHRPALSNAAHPWVTNIRAIVRTVADTSLLASLAQQMVPSRTLLYLHDWRQDPYDVDYPDYTPRAGVAAFISSARALGFRVMLHVDLIGVSPSNPDYASVQAFHTRTPDTLEPTGWRWELPPTTPYRFAYINPAAAAFRSLFITRVGAAINTLAPDALHLDISAPMYNDGNGPIEGRTYPQGSATLHDAIVAAFPSVALGGEGENDILARYHSFAQAWYAADVGTGHPIATFLFHPHVLFYGHLSQPRARDAALRAHLLHLQRRAVLPMLPVDSAADLDTSDADNARLLGILGSWQTHAFTPAWNADWTGAAVRYEGLSGSTAQFADTPTTATLTAAGTTVLRIVHDVDRPTTSSFIRSWPAFDATTLYGLNPAKQYYLDPLPRPATSHATSLPAGVQLGSGTLVNASFAHVALEPTPAPAFDFIAGLIEADTGVRYQGIDTPLGNGASVTRGSITAGGVTKSGLFLHPPYEGQIGGETFVQYMVAVPQAAVLQFSAGVADNAACTDGVTFRITIGGAEVWSRHVLRTGWRDVRLDLSTYAGTTVALRFISHPGPANQPYCDWPVFSGMSVSAVASQSPVSVPLLLESGSTAAAFDGDGTLSTGPGLSATVSGLRPPAAFTLFTQAGTPVAGGVNLATVPFDSWNAGRGELARPGAAVGAGSVGTATSGGLTKSPAVFAHPPFDGRTVLTWAVHLPAATPVRLGWSAGLSDGSASVDGVDFIVRVNGTSYAQTTVTTTGWRVGTLDLSHWRDQNVLIELVTDARGGYEYDWAIWADLVLSASATSCAYSVPPEASVAPTGGAFSVAVTATATCPWKAVSDAPWLTVVSPSGNGDGAVGYSVAPNPGGTRTGALVIAGTTVLVTQLASTLFTDDPLTPGVTPIRAVHVTELRARIDALRTRHGLPAYPWSGTPAPGALIRAEHVQDLRAALGQVYAAIGASLPPLTDPFLGPGTPVKAAHLAELRSAVIAIE